jgi:peroxiredoxin 5
MSFRTALRPLGLAARAPRAFPTATRSFHATRPAFIKVGDELPNKELLMETTPGNKVNLAEEAKHNPTMLLIGVPAAYSGACSATHIPSYVKHPKTKDFDMVAVIAVNDVFV